VADEYHDFYMHWLGQSTESAEPTGSTELAKSIFCSTFPYKLSLGAGPDGRSRPPFAPAVLGNEILVTEAYDKTFHRLLRLRMHDKGHDKGAVLTGQPGIGTSL
jgi:hypothetical protein